MKLFQTRIKITLRDILQETTKGGSTAWQVKLLPETPYPVWAPVQALSAATVEDGSSA